MVEPAYFSTDWAGSSSRHSAVLPAYVIGHAAADELHHSYPSAGVPKATAAALMKIVDAPEPPLRVFFGELPLEYVRGVYEARLKTWEEWQPVAIEAHG